MRMIFDKAGLPPPAEILRRLGARQVSQRGEWLTCCCPLHEDRRPSFSIHATVGNWRCFGCGATGGDVVDLYRAATGTSFREAVEALGAQRDTEIVTRPPAPRTTAVPAPLEWSETAECIWRRTQALRGTIGEVYLRHRGCALPPRDSHLRFLPGDGHHPPSLCAAITDATSGKPIRKITKLPQVASTAGMTAASALPASSTRPARKLEAQRSCTRKGAKASSSYGPPSGRIAW